MKKLKISLYCLLIFQFSCEYNELNQLNTFSVSGTIEGLDTSYMTTSYSDNMGNRINDTIYVENNHFIYTAKIDKPTHIVLWPNVERTIKRTKTGYYPAKSSQFAFLASPGDKIIFKGKVSDFIDAYPTGSKANDDLSIINSSIFPMVNKYFNLLLKKGEIEKENALYATALDDSIKALDDEVIRKKIEFINSNQNSEAAIWYLSDMMMRNQISDQEAVSVFRSIDLKNKGNPFYKEIEMRVKGIETTMIGRTIPDFKTTNTLDGKLFEFSSLRGKYVLIDFWGTWCGPCVAEMPKLKEYQEKYNQKLVVLGINSGDSKEKIEKFIIPKQYNWKHLLSGNGADDLVLKFNVSGFPTKFIIDPSGNILYKFVGEGKDSYKVLDELLK